jgi:hypothetical protein
MADVKNNMIPRANILKRFTRVSPPLVTNLD